MTRPTLNLNLATRPLRNRRLFLTAVRVMAALLVLLAGLACFIVIKYGGEASRLKSSIAETKTVQAEAQLQEKRLSTNIETEEKLSHTRVDLVNGIILRKIFSWNGLLSDLEEALPDPSYILSLSPSFTQGGAVALEMSVSSRNLKDLEEFITALNAKGFKDIRIGGEQRSEDGRLLTPISTTYERPH